MTKPTDYVFTMSEHALAYILAVLNRRPREECNDIYTMLERARDAQDAARDRLEGGGGLPGVMRAMQGNGATEGEQPS